MFITVVDPVSSRAGKSFSIVNGKITKGRATAPAKSIAFTVPCANLSDLAAIINRLKPGTAIILGYAEETIGEPFYHLWSERAIRDEFHLSDDDAELCARTADNVLVIPRKKSLFKNSPFFCIDRDVDADAPQHIAAIQSMQNHEFVALLSDPSRVGEQIASVFSDADYIAVASSSSQIFYPDNTPFSADPSAHLFFQAKDGSDIERFAASMTAQLIAAGLSYNVRVENKNGGAAWRKKLILDQSVFTRGRLFFESAPFVAPGIILRREPCFVVQKRHRSVDTANVLEPGIAVQTRLFDNGLSYVADGANSHFSCHALEPDMIIETERHGKITAQHYSDNIFEKLRCQTPFRNSNSWAAYLNRHEDNTIYLWDEGTRTKYLLCDPNAAEFLGKLAEQIRQNKEAEAEIAALAAEQSKDLTLTVADSPAAISPKTDVWADLYDEDDIIDPVMDRRREIEAQVQKAITPALQLAPKRERIVPLQASDLINATDMRTEKEMSIWGESCLMVRGGLTLFGGAPKSGKSTLTMQMAIAAALGGEFLGQKFAEPLTVLWIQAELRPEFLRARLLEQLGGYTKEQIEMVGKNLIVTEDCDCQLNRTDQLAYAMIIEKYKPDLVIIDPLRNLIHLKQESDATEMRTALASIKATAQSQSLDTAIVCVHHTRKDSGSKNKNEDGSPFDLFAGSGALRGYYDTGLVLLNDAQDPNTKYLHFELRHGAPMRPLTLTHKNGGMIIGDPMAEAIANVATFSDTEKREILLECVIDYLKMGGYVKKEMMVNRANLENDIHEFTLERHGFRVSKSTFVRAVESVNYIVAVATSGRETYVYLDESLQ